MIQLAEVISAPIEVLAYLRHGRNEVLPILAQYQSMIGRKPEGDDRRTACAGALEQLAVDHLSYRAEELAILKDVCARFTAGRKYLITGESGSGKSTLLRLIAQRQQEARRDLQNAETLLQREMKDRLAADKRNLAVKSARLWGLSPLKKISGGFGFITDGDGKGLETVEQAEAGKRITVRVKDGRIGAVVDHVEKYR